MTREGEHTEVNEARAQGHSGSVRARGRRAAIAVTLFLGALTVPVLAATPAMAAPYTCTTDNWNGSVCQSLTPSVNCVWHNVDGSWTAVFGYRNASPTYDITVPAGILNFMYPGAWNVGQPTYFPRGNVTSSFTATFSGASESWYLVAKGATATPASTKCAKNPVPALGSPAVTLRTLLIALPMLLMVARARRVRSLMATVPNVLKEHV
jgi:hypothetical protein